ncbi:MAG: FAD-dependent oxidoreductase [archaeon]|nr:FAD-dependent oxidoreductase [archaeon]
MKRVVIIGGGFTGANTAKILEKNFEVMLIDTKDYFEFTPSILKTLTNPELFNKIKLNHRDYLKKSRLVLGKAEKISKNSVFVNGREIFFDYLVIAAGSSYETPLKNHNSSPISKLNNIEGIHKKIEFFKKIVIVGGGPVGVELASELITFYPGKEVVLFTSSGSLIPRNSQKSQKIAQDFLKKKGVKINLNKRIISKENTSILENGKVITGDYFFLCTGIKNNSGFIEKSTKEMLNEKNQVKVNSFLQVRGFKNIFAGGDIIDTDEEKTAQSAVLHSWIINRNIINMEKRKSLIKYKIKKRLTLISLGRANGILEYKGFSLGGLIPAILKKIIEKRQLIGLKTRLF